MLLTPPTLPCYFPTPAAPTPRPYYFPPLEGGGKSSSLASMLRLRTLYRISRMHFGLRLVITGWYRETWIHEKHRRGGAHTGRARGGAHIGRARGGAHIGCARGLISSRPAVWAAGALLNLAFKLHPTASPQHALHPYATAFKAPNPKQRRKHKRTTSKKEGNSGVIHGGL